jgi:V/A-type H+-transporting ATPase subunit I
MSVQKVQKIQLIGLKKDQKNILSILQNSGVVEIKEISEDLKSKKEEQKNYQQLQEVNLNHANIEFAIKLLSKYEKKKGLLEGPIEIEESEVIERTKNFDFKKLVKDCYDIEDKIVKAKNKIAKNENELKLYNPIKNLPIALKNLEGSKNAAITVGSLSADNLGTLIETIGNLSKLSSVEIISKDGKTAYVYVLFPKELATEVKKALTETKFSEIGINEKEGNLAEFCEKLKEEINESEKTINSEVKKIKKLAEEIDNLKILHDYNAWEKEKTETTSLIGNTESSFVINAWIANENVEKIEAELSKKTKDFHIGKIKLKEGEVPPIILKNSKFMMPFEAVTRTYGLPLYNELDPTPYLSIFFIIFFALCLTDAGYGIIMFASMWAAQRFLKLPLGTKKLVRLLMYGGIVTFVIGALFGGWFGLEADQVPAFLTYTGDDGELYFMFQKINALKDPLTVLIIALGLGFIQILTGTFMKLVHEFKTVGKKEALLGTGPWAVLLSGIGLFVLSKTAITNSSFGLIALITVMIGLALVVLIPVVNSSKEAIENSKKQGAVVLIVNVILKGIIIGGLKGILGLYNLVAYMSDVLSYSRLLALGLATTIIGLAVNIIAALMYDIPYIGWIFMIIVLVGGHAFNLLINALGSFIHSGRLQFVEFFGKFMEGGGEDFKPFNKKNKYIYIINQ